MNAKHFLLSATVASMLACAMPAGAQVLGGGLGGALGGTLSAVAGPGGLGGPTSSATGTLRDLNDMGRATTAHAHDTVRSATLNTDRAVARVDGQTQAIAATAQAAGSGASNADAHLGKAGEAAKPDRKEQPLKVPANAPSDLKAERVSAAPTKPAPQQAMKLPDARISTDVSAAADASSDR